MAGEWRFNPGVHRAKGARALPVCANGILTIKREAPNPRIRRRGVEIVSGLYGYLMLSSSQKKPRSTGIAEVNRYNTGRPTENRKSEEHVHQHMYK